MSPPGPILPTLAVRQVDSYLAYTGRDADVGVKAARDPIRTFGHLVSSNSALRAPRRRVGTDGSDLESDCRWLRKPLIVLRTKSTNHAGRCSWTALHPLPSRVQITAADDLCDRSAVNSVEPSLVNVRSALQLGDATLRAP